MSTLQEDAQALTDAWIVLRDELIKTLRLVEITEWLNKRLLKMMGHQPDN